MQNANVFHQAVRSEDNYFLTIRKCAALGQAVGGLCQVQEATRLIDMILFNPQLTYSTVRFGVYELVRPRLLTKDKGWYPYQV